MTYHGIQQSGMLPAISGLLISGRGDNGAFGAGLLAGWSAHGDRLSISLRNGGK